MAKPFPYLFVIVFLLLAFIQFNLFYNAYTLKREEVHAKIQKQIHQIKQRIEKHESERHQMYFNQYKSENLCEPSDSNTNFDLTFRITPKDTFSNLKDLTDIISKKLANQALMSGSFMLASLPLDSTYIERVVKEELTKISPSINVSTKLSSDSNQTGYAYNYYTVLFDDYKLYHPTYLLMNVTELSKILFYQLALLLAICLATMVMLFIVSRNAYVSIVKFKKLSDDKAEFINHLAHEIKTPLSSIYVSSQALSDQRINKTKETIAQYSDIIFLEAEKLNKQLENVLSISAAEKNFLTMQMEETDIHKLIEQVSELFTKRIALQNGSIKLHLTATRSRYPIDRIHFGNVLYNLCDNAVKYANHKCININIETENTAGGISIRVSDNGRGISEADQQKIFTLFYKKDTQVKGFGVGLHYAQKIMHFHNGSIDVKSKIGIGTLFSLYVPNESHE